MLFKHRARFMQPANSKPTKQRITVNVSLLRDIQEQLHLLWNWCYADWDQIWILYSLLNKMCHCVCFLSHTFIMIIFECFCSLLSDSRPAVDHMSSPILFFLPLSSLQRLNEKFTIVCSNETSLENHRTKRMKEK